MVKFKLQNKLVYTILSVLTIIVIAIGINAYGTTNPSVLGHTFGELAPPTGCASNQVVQWTGSAWACVSPALGDITGVTSGVGLSGGATSGDATLNLANPIKTCAAGQAMNNFNLGVPASPTCVAGGGTLNPTTYFTLDGGTSAMGTHKFCFLTQVRYPGNDAVGCKITESLGSWTLAAGSLTTRCEARCVD